MTRPSSNEPFCGYAHGGDHVEAVPDDLEETIHEQTFRMPGTETSAGTVPTAAADPP